jgi:hypothetical protein
MKKFKVTCLTDDGVRVDASSQRFGEQEAAAYAATVAPGRLPEVEPVSLSTDEIRTEVDEALRGAGISYKITLIGERTEYPLSKDSKPWMHDLWWVTFSKGRYTEDFDYRTGTGHRVLSKTNQSLARTYARTMGAREFARWKETAAKAVAPRAADVLHCLLADVIATRQSFASWCGEFGYDTDSRHAESIYRACQENADKLNRVIPSTVQSTLNDLLQDY